MLTADQQSAEVFAEAPNGGLELGDAAQQDRSAEISAHGRILSKSRQPSKGSKWRKVATPTDDGHNDSPLELVRGEPRPSLAVA